MKRSVFILVFWTLSSEVRAGKSPLAVLPYVPKIDGIPCDKGDWDPNAVPHPVLQTTQGKVKGMV